MSDANYFIVQRDLPFLGSLFLFFKVGFFCFFICVDACYPSCHLLKLCPFELERKFPLVPLHEVMPLDNMSITGITLVLGYCLSWALLPVMPLSWDVNLRLTSLNTL